MTERTTTTSRLWILLAALSVVTLGASLGGCASDHYYCDSTGCFFCDGAGCRAATPPTRTVCRGDYQCTAGQICTNLGCTLNCRADGDCPQGWVCRGGSGGDAGASSGVCVTPTETMPTPMPGACSTDADCGAGTVCIDGTCHMSTTPACTADTGCTGAQICIANRCTDPTSTCQFDDQCGANRVCVNSQCVGTCSAASCPAGTMCVTSGAVMYCEPTPGMTCAHNADCGAGNVCVNGACGAGCTPGSTSTTQCPTGDYCTADGVCAVDTRPHPFCDATHPCAAGSDCIDGVCRVPCTADAVCRMVDVTYTNCGMLPSQTATGQYCLTSHEFHPLCARESECSTGQSCIDGQCL